MKDGKLCYCQRCEDKRRTRAAWGRVFGELMLLFYLVAALMIWALLWVGVFEGPEAVFRDLAKLIP